MQTMFTRDYCHTVSGKQPTSFLALFIMLHVIVYGYNCRRVKLLALIF